MALAKLQSQIVSSNKIDDVDNSYSNGGINEDDKALKKFFKPEFRNRLDATVKFSRLDDLAMRKIVAKFINELNELISDKHIKIIVSEASVDWLIKHGFDAKMGARPLARKIEESIKVPVSKKILFDHLGAGTIINVDMKDNELIFEVNNKNNTPVVKKDGYIVLEQFKPKS